MKNKDIYETNSERTIINFPLYLLMTIFLVASSQILAQNGSLDPSFGNGGIVTATCNGVVADLCTPTDLVLQPDGKTVVLVSAPNVPANTGRDFYVFRFLWNGTFDPGFGNGGIARIFFTPQADSENPFKLAVQADGKIVVVGSAALSNKSNSPNGFAVARLNSNGTLDSSFGSGGKLLFNFSSRATAAAKSLAIQADGKILVGGNSDANFAVVRLLPTNGAFDSTFNGTGVSIIQIPINRGQSVGNPGANGLAIQPDGKIILAGQRPAVTGTGGDFAVFRLHAGGSPDASFGSNGQVTTNFFGSNDSANAAEIDFSNMPNFKIVVGGEVRTSDPDTRFGIVRYNQNGSLDTSFNGGKITVGPSGFDSRLYSMKVDSFGRIYASGSVKNFTTLIADLSLARILPTGVLDPSFGIQGFVFTDIQGEDRNWGGLAFTPDGRVVVAGDTNSRRVVVVARYFP